MRDDNDGHAAFLEFSYGSQQRSLALVIQIRVSLIENDELGFAEDRAGQRNAFALATRESKPILADVGVVSPRQPSNHLMNAGQTGRRDYRLGIPLLIRAIFS